MAIGHFYTDWMIVYLSLETSGREASSWLSDLSSQYAVAPVMHNHNGM